MLAPWSESNGMAEPLPQGAAELIPGALARIERGLWPSTAEDRTGLMQRLWDAGVPQPVAETLDQWHRLLAPFPADILAKAFDEVAKTHRWPSPPAIADVVKFAQPMHDARLSWKRKLETAAMRAEIEAREAEEAGKRQSQWERNLTPEQAATLAAIRKQREQGVSYADMLAGLLPGGAR